MSNPKVFEYAKEIGMTPLALMDKIREWQLPVKSHMAELSPDLLSLIQEKMSEGSKPAAAAKPTTVKKAAARKKAPAAPKPTTVKKAAASAAAATEPASKTKAGPTVVRRKAKTAEELKAEEAPETALDASAETEAEVETPVAPVEVEAPVVKPAAKAAKAAPVEEVIETVEEAPVKAAPPPKMEEALAPVAASVVTEKAEGKPAVIPASPVTAAAASAPAAPAPTASAAASAPTSAAAAKIVPRKKEVAIGQSGVASDVAPTTVRRNIVGRMDLSRVQPPPGSRPPREGGPRGPGAPGGGPGTGFRPGPKGNLRAGFVAAAPPPDLNFPSQDDDRRRGGDDKRRRGGVGDAPSPGANARDLDAAPPAFDAAEFRKREMVFQPKKKKIGIKSSTPIVKTTPAAHKRIVKVDGTMKVGDLGQAMGVKATDLIKLLMKNGVMATINTALDFDTIALLVPDLGWEAQSIQKTDTDVVAQTAFGDLEAEPVERPPVVTIMGHVDHGKTSLLDAIRHAKVAEGEAGGITQHIGAYQVSLDDGYKITFLDTPGHAAFTAMRARGANVTDIVIIVVAADDGVMPQTAEAINHAKAAGVPIIIAVNKIDKPGANPEKIKQQLTEYEIVPEEWGGSNIFVNVSALKKTGIPELLEQIRLVAEVAELKANPKRSGRGVVVESRIEKGRGPVATVLVQDGTVEVGQYMVAGVQKGRVRSLMNDRGERVTSATPGTPIQIHGLDGVPMAGDKIDMVKDERAAEEVVEIRRAEIDKASRQTGKSTLEEIFAKATAGDVKELNVVLKADVAGSLEALQGMFAKLGTKEVKVKIIHSAVGGITENDVMLASTAGGMIIGFNVRPDGNANQAAKSKGVEVRTYSIVYELIDDMKKAMSGMLTPDVVEKVQGRAEVRNTFTVPKIGMIAGCFVSDGKINRSSQARLIRDGKIVYEGKIGSLKRFKDDAREVATGFECGIGIENFNDIKVGDVIEAFTKEEVARSLEAPEAQA